MRPGAPPGPLIAKGGQVDPAALFRAAKAAAISKAGKPSTQSVDVVAPAAPVARVEPVAPVAPVAPPSETDLDLDTPDGDDDLLPLDATEQAPIAPTIAAPAPPQRVAFTLQHDLSKRLDKYLCDRITFMSRSKLQALIEAGGVTVNGRVAKSSSVLHAGDKVEVLIPPPPSEDFEPQDIPLDVLYEDAHMIVLNKDAGIIVHPARTHTHGTLINALAFHFRNRSATGGGLSSVGKQFARPGVVHRLDRHTSGCIVFAKTEQAHGHLAGQFMHRTANKRYVAIAHGHLAPPIDVIDLPLGPHPSRTKGYREMQVVRHDHLGRPALTVYRTLEMYGSSEQKHWPDAGAVPAGASLAEVELKTGRTHQIRVHFAHQGFPLVGDDMYGGRPLDLLGVAAATKTKSPKTTAKKSAKHAACQPVGTFARQALHAALLEIRHPVSNQPMRFVAPLPPDLRALITTLRTYGATPHQLPGTILTMDELLA